MRQPIPSFFYVLVLVEHEGRVLFVQEAKHGQTWYLPAGGVEPGESLAEAAARETLEEAGVRVRPGRVLGVEQDWFCRDGRLCSRWRFVLVATLDGDAKPKSVADRHTLGARWIHPREMGGYAWRDPEVHRWARLVAD